MENIINKSFNIDDIRLNGTESQLGDKFKGIILDLIEFSNNSYGLSSDECKVKSAELISRLKPYKYIISTDILWYALTAAKLYPNDFKLDLSDIHNLTVTYLDYGWDYYVDPLEKTFSRFDVMQDLSIEDIKDDLNSSGLRTLNLFKYYNEFANKMTEKLTEIFGEAQECFLGYEEGFVIGFDVLGGSILTEMPIGAHLKYKIQEYDPSDRSKFMRDRYDEVKVLFRPYSFYGSNENHFFNTSGRCSYEKCPFASEFIRLD